jgi:3-hydroxyisobutyrate dehydrogenase-like beta-hydroxyacid dehydrogenase
MVRRCEIILSICPPHAAVDVARQIASTPTVFDGIYVDANAISPKTTAIVSTIISARGGRYVDGGILGSPPPSSSTRLCLSGSSAQAVAELFSAAPLEIVELGESAIAASALKMAYATWSKGGSALLLAIQAMAKHYGVEEALLTQWRQSQPELLDKSNQAALSAMAKGWRWSGEMEEISVTLANANLPDGFGRAAAEIYRRVPRQRPIGDENDLARVLGEITG